MSKRKRRGKRVFPIRYASDYINVTQRPRSLDLDRKDSEGDHWFDRYTRVQSTVGPKTNKEPKFNGTFMQEVPKTIGRVRHSWVDEKGVIHYADPTPKMETEAKLRELKKREPHNEITELTRKWVSTITKWGIDKYQFMIVAESGDYTLKLFFSCNSFYWIEENRASGIAKRSREYIGRASAMRVYEYECIDWRFTEDLHQSTRT